LKYQLNTMKIICCFLTITIIISVAASGVYAMTQGQKSVGDIGADITWYDFGDTYTSYYINDDLGTGFYALTMSDGSTISKTGFVNSKGELVLEPVAYGGFSTFGGGEGSVFGIKTGDGNYTYIDSDGIKVIDGTAYSEMGFFDNEYATVTLKSNSRKGVIDKNGSLIFEDKEGKYKEFRFLGSGIFAAEINENNYDFLDSTGAPLTETHYTNDWLWGVSEETILVSKDGKYGFLDLSGNEIVPLIYDNAYSFGGGLAAVCKNGKWGFADKTGKEVILPAFDEVRPYFNNDLIAVSIDGKWGLVDKAGDIVLPVEYDYVMEYDSGFFVAKKENRSFLLDASGKLVSTEDYSSIYLDPSSQIHVEKILNDATVNAYLDENETMLTGWKEFSLIYLSDQLYLGAKYGEYPPGVAPPHDYLQKFALLDSGGNNLTGFRYSNTGNFLNNFLVVNKYYYGTAGLVNQYGAEVLPTIFDDILLTDEGYAFITISDENSGTSRVGYFKIPESFSNIKNTKPITVYLNGTELYFDSEPVIKNQKTMVPVRKIFNSLGASVEWDGITKTVTSGSGDKNISLTIGSDIAYVNGSEIQLEAAPFLQDDITFVPLKFVSENLGADVKWDGDLRRVLITSNE
jgi:hypothetical protein